MLMSKYHNQFILNPQNTKYTADSLILKLKSEDCWVSEMRTVIPKILEILGKK